MPVNTGTAVALQTPGLERIKALVLDSVRSDHSRRAFDRALSDFLSWHQAEAAGEGTRAAVLSATPAASNPTGSPPPPSSTFNVPPGLSHSSMVRWRISCLRHGPTQLAAVCLERSLISLP
jgi:hypothetical protein